MKIACAAQTDIGKKRTQNEDIFVVDPDLGLYLVSDGVGGHASGEVAAQISGETIQQYLADNRPRLAQAEDTKSRLKIASELLGAAIRKACAAVYETAQQEFGRRGMGATVTAIWVVGNKALIGHVGDSRLYLLRGGQSHLMTQDHTLAAEFVRIGTITAAEAHDHPAGNVLVRAIGERRTVQADVSQLDLLAGDRIVICSDGLSNYLENSKQLADLAGSGELQPTVDALVEWANAAGGRDNITAVLISVHASEATRRQELERKDRIEQQLQLLSQTFLCQNLKYRYMVRIYNKGRVWQYDADSVVVPSGERCDQLYLVLDGELEATSDDGGTMNLPVGSLVGALTLFGQQNSTVEIRARIASRLLTIDAESLQKLIQRKLRLGVPLLKNLMQMAANSLESPDIQFLTES